MTQSFTYGTWEAYNKMKKFSCNFPQAGNQVIFGHKIKTYSASLSQNKMKRELSVNALNALFQNQSCKILDIILLLN